MTTFIQTSVACSGCDREVSIARVVEIAVIDATGDSDEGMLCASCAVDAGLPVCRYCGEFFEESDLCDSCEADLRYEAAERRWERSREEW